MSRQVQWQLLVALVTPGHVIAHCEGWGIMLGWGVKLVWSAGRMSMGLWLAYGPGGPCWAG